jgi:hypothetical protein
LIATISVLNYALFAYYPDLSEPVLTTLRTLALGTTLIFLLYASGTLRWVLEPYANRFRKIGDFEKERFFDEITKMLVNEAEARDFNEAERHQLVYRIQRGVMPEFVIADYGRVILKDEEFRAVFKKFSDDNWTSFERK